MNESRQGRQNPALATDSLSSLTGLLPHAWPVPTDESVGYGRSFLAGLPPSTLRKPELTLGEVARAEMRFREAEQMQQERQPDYPLLYLQGGFLYCDLLLARPRACRVATDVRERGCV